MAQTAYPTPEQHRLGGYNTWAARSAGLKSQLNPESSQPIWVCWSRFASRRVVLITKQRPSRHRGTPEESSGLLAFSDSEFPSAKIQVLTTTMTYESDPASSSVYKTAYTWADQVNRCVHFAGGRVRASIPLIPIAIRS